MVKRGKWTCGLRVWLESDGHVVLGRGRVELLEAIERHHSIRAAAASLRM
jgi:molybdenum-dependent DNA-binding transcriptional regulator ModE